jgi:hypothetical protein
MLKRNFLVIIGAALMLVLYSCGGGSSPSGIAKKMLNAGKSGDAEQVEKVILQYTDSKTMRLIQLFESKLKGSNLLNNVASLNAVVNNGAKIADFSITSENKGSTSAVVATKVIFVDGKEINDVMQFVKEDGKWKIKLTNL